MLAARGARRSHQPAAATDAARGSARWIWALPALKRRAGRAERGAGWWKVAGDGTGAALAGVGGRFGRGCGDRTPRAARRRDGGVYAGRMSRATSRAARKGACGGVRTSPVGDGAGAQGRGYGSRGAARGGPAGRPSEKLGRFRRALCGRRGAADGWSASDYVVGARDEHRMLDAVAARAAKLGAAVDGRRRRRCRPRLLRLGGTRRVLPSIAAEARRGAMPREPGRGAHHDGVGSVLIGRVLEAGLKVFASLTERRRPRPSTR